MLFLRSQRLRNKEVDDLSHEDEDHDGGNDKLEADIEEAIAPELVSGLFALRYDCFLGLVYPATPSEIVSKKSSQQSMAIGTLYPSAA